MMTDRDQQKEIKSGWRIKKSMAQLWMGDRNTYGSVRSGGGDRANIFFS